MNLSITGLWPARWSTFGRRTPTPSNALPAGSRNAADKADLDPQRLSRTRLLAELLAPAPNLGPGEAGLATDVDSGSVLPPAVGAAIARKLSIARELLHRDLLADLRSHPIMDRPDTLGEWLQLHCAGLDHEVFLVLYLDVRNRLITVEQLFRGTLAQVSVYPREVVKGALRHGAAALVLAHNHPSGTPEPSGADHRITQQLKSALGFIDVQVLDHIIVAGGSQYSFAEHGVI